MTECSTLEAALELIRKKKLETTTQFVVDHASKGFGSHGKCLLFL